jgi:hypothetical protein
MGIRLQAARIDLAPTQRCKDGIVARLTGGVGALLETPALLFVEAA